MEIRIKLDFSQNASTFSKFRMLNGAKMHEESDISNDNNDYRRLLFRMLLESIELKKHQYFLLRKWVAYSQSQMSYAVAW